MISQLCSSLVLNSSVKSGSFISKYVGSKTFTSDSDIGMDTNPSVGASVAATSVDAAAESVAVASVVAGLGLGVGAV
eukprot:CAMPEP_0181138892 /NCGR_PEP_ID=MMETSP1071-20121207/34489_1 /TAXON_ID=35127 /ORGANISM="Thalassiosira sp., Strain NH16" /LENGTH=76 /DNA_ID=CAMNT_0023225759 /DNA_START=161 /DNA_END=391 /DNA_ORIENTATION=+